MGVRLNLKFFAILLCGLSIMNVAAALKGAALGEGYKTKTGVVTPKSCFAESVTDHWMEDMVMSNPQADLQFKQVNSFDELQKLLDVSGSVSASAGGWGAKVGGGFLDQVGSSSRSVHIIYAYEYKYNALLNLQLSKYRNRTERLSLLKSKVRNWYTSAGSEYPQLIYNQCGDRYASDVSAGVVLVVAITMNFGSAAAKDAFKAELGVSGSVGVASVGVSAAFGMAQNNVSSGTSLTVSAQQFGGAAIRLQDATLGEPDSSGMYQIQKCGSDIKDPTKCDRLVKNIIDYSHTLVNQVRGSNGEIDKTILFYSDPTYTPYEVLFGSVGVLDIERQQVILSKLRASYDELKRDISMIDEYLLRANEVFGGSGTLSSISGGALLGSLSDYRKVLINNKNLYDSNEALKNCFKSATMCDVAQQGLDVSKLSKPEYAKPASYLRYIKENVFSISNLLTIKNVINGQKPEFKHISCDLIPLKPESGTWMNALSGCDASSGRPVIRHIISADEDRIEVEEFNYFVKIGENEYRLTYPKAVLYGSEFAEYTVDDETQFPKIKYAECKRGVCSGMQDISSDQIDHYPGTNAFNMRQEDLINMYPDILH